MNEQFKAGDEVYCPRLNNKIHVVKAHDSKTYPIAVLGLDLKPNGCYHEKDDLSCIFHATPENKALLEALYKCEFEPPKLKGSDLTRKLLSEGKHVLCWMSDDSDILAPTHAKNNIVFKFNKGLFFTLDGSSFEYAVPCNDYANLVDGVLIKGEQ